jgi:hypothetical protein
MNQEESPRAPSVAFVARQLGFPIPLYRQTQIFRLNLEDADADFTIELGSGGATGAEVRVYGNRYLFLVFVRPIFWPSTYNDSMVVSLSRSLRKPDYRTSACSSAPFF